MTVRSTVTAPLPGRGSVPQRPLRAPASSGSSGLTSDVSATPSESNGEAGSPVVRGHEDLIRVDGSGGSAWSDGLV